MHNYSKDNVFRNTFCKVIELVLKLSGTDFTPEWLRGPNWKLMLPSGLLILTARWTGEL